MKQLEDMTVCDIASVYVGKRGKCACGCSGSHTYTQLEADAVEREHRAQGYAGDPRPKNVDDREVGRVLALAQKARAEFDTNNFAFETKSKLFIVYPNAATLK